MNNKKTPRNEERRCLTQSLKVLFQTLLVLIVALGMMGMETCPVYAAGYQAKTKTKSYDISVILDGIAPEMKISGVSGIKKSDFIWAMENCPYDRNDVLQNNAEFIWEKCQEYDLNEFFLCGLIAVESGWCDSKLSESHHNVMSIKGNKGYKYYSSYEECIEDGCILLSEKYLNPKGSYYNGQRLIDIAAKYVGTEDKTICQNWADLVAECAGMSAKALIKK